MNESQIMMHPHFESVFWAIYKALKVNAWSTGQSHTHRDMNFLISVNFEKQKVILIATVVIEIDVEV